jgi:hypothetical protein
MGSSVKLPFIGQAYENRSIPVSSQRCVNWYPEIEPESARNVITLQAVSGTKLFLDIAESDLDFIRGMRFSHQLQLLYVVSGNELYEIQENGVKTLRGTIPGSAAVIMSDNGRQIGIVNTLQYQVYDSTTTTLSNVLDSGGGPLVARDIGFLDGRFILMTQDQRYFITAPNDALTVDALDFDDVEGNPDALTGLLVANRRIWFGGENSYEHYFDSQQLAAAGEFPIARVDGGSQNGYGLAGLLAKVVQDSAPYWCSNDGRIYRTNGYLPERISNFGIENSIRSYPDISDCEASEWTENGHRFVAFSFPAGGETWVYDTTSNMWHQRSTGLSGGIWDVNFTETAWNRVIVGSRSSDKLGELDLDTFTEYGESMKARRTSPVIHSNQNIVFTDRLELVMEMGRASINENAQLGLRWSDDGGVTFGNWVFESLGLIGEYQNRVVFWSLGQSVNRVYDLQITDDVRRTLIDCVVEAEVGDI